MQWNDLNENHNFSFLCTNRLNQDCAENLLSIVRGRGGHRDNPTPEQFRGAFRQIVVEQLLIPSENSNCKFDIDKVLLDISSISTMPAAPSIPENDVQSASVTPETISIMNGFNTPDDCVQNVCAYITGYLLKHSRIVCSNCKEKCVLEKVPSNTEMYTFIREKTYENHGSLICPSQDFVSFVEDLETYFTLNFPNYMYMGRVMFRLFTGTKMCMENLSNIFCGERNCYTN